MTQSSSEKRVRSRSKSVSVNTDAGGANRETEQISGLVFNRSDGIAACHGRSQHRQLMRFDVASRGKLWEVSAICQVMLAPQFVLNGTMGCGVHGISGNPEHWDRGKSDS